MQKLPLGSKVLSIAGYKIEMESALMEALTYEEEALIMLSIEEYLTRLRIEYNRKPNESLKELQEKQTKKAQSIYKKLLGLHLSDDGMTVSSLK